MNHLDSLPTEHIEGVLGFLPEGTDHWRADFDDDGGSPQEAVVWTLSPIIPQDQATYVESEDEYDGANPKRQKVLRNGFVDLAVR